MSKLSTTTWPKRHRQTFNQLADFMNQYNIKSPTVLEVGPGATSSLLKNLLASGEGEDLSFWANRLRAFLRNVDSLIRHIPFVDLHSFEPGELLDVLPADARLIVSDINPRVIKAIAKQYPQADARVIDFADSPMKEPVDIIVCLCVIVRTSAPKTIFKNLYDSLKPGGLFVIDNRSITNFSDSFCVMERLAPQIWRKTGNS